MSRLLVIKGADEGKQFELADPVITLGRDASSRIRLHDTEVSRRHAEFRRQGDETRLVDVGSANGTYLNNRKVQEATLQAGDHILIGQTTLVFSASRSEAESITAPSDLAEKINMITRGDLELSSAIVKTIGETEGSRILAQPDKAASPWLKNALASLTVMYEASQAVSHILDITQLLDRILEIIFRSIIADRGCALLCNPDTGELEPKALRYRKAGSQGEKLTISRSIPDYVLKERQGVLLSDASRDERFNTGESIVKFGIREVICVPIKGRHETLGVLYLDTHSTGREMVARKTATGKFTEDHLTLAIAVAHQAALAVEETRYHHAMVQAERLAAIGQTIAALSHHIKNILQGLRSGSEILQMGFKEKNDTLIQQGWRVAEKNQAKIYDLVMDMLSYSKERVPAVEPTKLNESVREVVELLAGRTKELGVHLELSLVDNMPIVQVDREGIHRALLNIVGNALDAVEERPNPHVTVGTRVSDQGWARIVVVDNGIGIPPVKLGEIFKPFVSTKGAKGTGLGLAVSRKILREHGGDILVQSQVGVGSKFILRLPIRSPLSIDPSVTSAEMAVLPPPEAD
ncbi:MAG: FHA domain-containing protein [Planctomycetes bacterium]|nr:FHA domain-containing protein [Planctomycetota bacterium]